MCFSNVVEMFKNGEISDQTTFDRLTADWTSVAFEDFWSEVIKAPRFSAYAASLYADILVRYLERKGLIDYAGVADKFFAQYDMGVREFTIKSICENAEDWLNTATDKEADSLQAEWAEHATKWFWPNVLEHCVEELNYYNGYACKVALAKCS